MFSRFTARGLVTHDYDEYPMPNLLLVEIGGADGLNFEQTAPGNITNMQFYDPAHTKVQFDITHHVIENDGSVIEARYVVPADMTIGVESDNPNAYPHRHGAGYAQQV